MSEPRTATSDHEIVRALAQLHPNDPQSTQELWGLAYDRLRRLAAGFRRHPADVVHQTTDLVHATYELLQRQRAIGWRSPAQFFAIAALAMRRLVVTWARQAVRSTPQAADEIALDVCCTPVSDAARMLDLDEALARLERRAPRCARVVELRFFGGLEMAEILATLESPSVRWRTTGPSPAHCSVAHCSPDQRAPIVEQSASDTTAPRAFTPGSLTKICW